MRFCPICGNEISDIVKICPYCGVQLDSQQRPPNPNPNPYPPPDPTPRRNHTIKFQPDPKFSYLLLQKTICLCGEYFAIIRYNYIGS